MELSGRTAFITGAASGIGWGIASALAARGVNIAVADVRASAASQAASELARVHGVRTLAVETDVSNWTSMRAAAERTCEALGPVTLLVNNAGIGVLGENLDELSELDVDRMIGVNFSGVVYGVRAFLPDLRKTGGHIINVSSIGGLHVMPGWRYALYAATKAAIVSLSEGLRDDLDGSGVSVSVLCPGGVRTNIHGQSATGAAHENREAVSQGMDPLLVGEFVAEGIQANRFLILTHPELRPLVERRYGAFMAAFDEAEKVAQSLASKGDLAKDKHTARGGRA